MTKTLIINYIERQTIEGAKEILSFKPGVNTIVGPPNSGKTKWLNMLDYLFGGDGKPEAAFGDDLSEKYSMISAEIEIGNEKIKIERRWKEQGVKGKIFIDDKPIDVEDFSTLLLKKLDIPILHFPKGNPYSERKWPELSWRMLLRHIYRQERFWSDIADKQPESEQFAVLTQFLGIAEKLFPKELEDAVNKRKELFMLKGQKEQFKEILDRITTAMISDSNTNYFATPQTLNESIEKLNYNISELNTKRENILKGALKDTTSLEDIQLSEKRSELALQLDELIRSKIILFKRIDDLKLLKSSITDESNKLHRAKKAGIFFKDLRITHCPACDQEVSYNQSSPENCFLCHRTATLTKGSERFDFEIHQLNAEENELVELIQQLEKEKIDLINYEKRLNNDLSLIESRLLPIRSRIGALVDPQISILDAERGRITEQVENLKRLLNELKYRDELSKKIDILNIQITELENLIESLDSDLNLESIGNDLEDGMITYLNKLNEDSNRWTEGRINVDIGKREFKFKVSNTNWSKKLGGTLRCYFLMAYHYALMTLTLKPGYHYPGLCIIDFPPQLPDGELIADKENYLVKPFITLFNERKEQQTQVIIAGRAFENLEGANIIELNTSWK